MEELLIDFENAIRLLQNLNDELRDMEANNIDMVVHSDEIEYALEDLRSEVSDMEVEHMLENGGLSERTRRNVPND
jgi:intracellular sulfur oxidation DsrE/DsrF family protein